MTRKCDLCLTEKMIIARSDPKKLLNKRTELVSKCRHRNNSLFQIRFETQLSGIMRSKNMLLIS